MDDLWLVFRMDHGVHADESIRFLHRYRDQCQSRWRFFQSSLSLADGKMATPQLAASTSRSTFLCFHPTLNVLYSVAELSQGDGAGKPAVIAWQVNGESGALTEIGNQSAVATGLLRDGQSRWQTAGGCELRQWQRCLLPADGQRGD